MKEKLILVFGIFGLIISQLYAQQLAFPDAEGFGKYATGGRNGSVYRVTNLNDSGSGSLRDAVSQSNRIVVFEVAGIIKITSRIVVSSNIYIVGQTAPGEGITIYGNGFSFSGANNTICRYIRIRMGAIGDSGKDALGIANGSNMIFDHVSVSWGRDETFSVSWDGKGTEPTNITIQNSIMSQGLLSHSAGGLIQTNGGVTLYRNFYIDNDTRNNKIKGVNQYVNNIVYNWKSGAYIMGGDSEGISYANAVGNYFIKGPANGVSPFSAGNANFNIYALDNWHDANRNGTLDGYEIPYSEYSGGPTFKSVPYDYPVLPTLPATSLLNELLPHVGASLPYRDYADYYVINELTSFGIDGDLISNENELPFGVPTAWNLWGGIKRTDSDNDGIPDEWELSNGLNPNLASDAMVITGNGYTNIENYINGITADYSQDYLRKPLCLGLKSATQNNLTIEWLDYTEKEDGYCIERYINGTFVEIARTLANQNNYSITGLQPEETDTFRVRAFNSSGYSDYSNHIICKTKPIPVEVIDPLTFVPDLIWNGNENLNWDKTSVNWLKNNVATVFSDTSSVLFTDTVVGLNQVITITDIDSIKTMVVNSSKDFIFQGNGKIAGKGSINKIGSGQLALLTDNTYTGATVIWDGVLQINKLANGGLSSSIGASQNYAFNWVWRGGKIEYTGSTVSTDRNVALDENTEFSVTNSAATVTFNGNLEGTGGLIKSGSGKLYLTKANPYEGETVIKGGILELNGLTAINGGLGSSNKLKLEGGTLKTSGGSTTDYEYYYFDIFVAPGFTSGFEPYRNCYIKSKVSGSGNLNFNIYYVREYIQGDWSQFSGTLFANGLGTTSDGNQLLLQNGTGIPNARVVTSGNTKIVCWTNASTMYLGGLSGPSGTYLSGADKQNNGATMKWIVGGAGTDETFSGVINNECSNKSYKGTTTIVKEGSGIWRLNGNNIYSGTTTITGGTLIVNGTHAGTAQVTVQNEAKLAGKGTMPSLVSIQTGGAIEPGDASISNFTVSSLSLNSGSYCYFDINKNTGTSDRIVATGTITVNGILNLNITGTLTAGDQFTLFTGNNINGAFESIVPEKPGIGLDWEFSNGILRVVNAVNLPNVKATDAINVIPNPVVNTCIIELGATYSQIEAVLYDIYGKRVFSCSEKHSGLIALNLGNLSSGIYIVNIIADGQLLPVCRINKK